MKPKVYIETSVVSYLTSKRSRDLIVAAHQQVTAQWWEERAPKFELVASELVVAEVTQGDAEAAHARLDVVRQMSILNAGNNALALSEQLVNSKMLPTTSAADALHIAIAAVNGIDYLLTWNYKHLANASLRVRVSALVSSLGHCCPIICTPEDLMED